MNTLINIPGGLQVLPEFAAGVWTGRTKLDDMKGVSRDLRNGHSGVRIQHNRPDSRNKALVPGVIPA
jgi:hypothetical protein